MKTKDIITDLQEKMPDKMPAEELAAFVMTILHGYMDTEEVIEFLRGVAEVCEIQQKKIEEAVKENVAAKH